MTRRVQLAALSSEKLLTNFPKVESSSMRKGRVETLKLSLSHDAHAKTVLNGGYKGHPVAKSPHIERMLAVYRISTIGRVVVVYAPADSGKTRAAEYMIHGNHPHRPDCSLMLSAASMKDFSRDFYR
jgi:hypothetical protein